MMGFQDYRDFVQWFCAALMGVYVLKNSYLAWLSYVQTQFVYHQQYKVSRRLMSRYLRQPYTFYLQRNTAEILRNLNVEVPDLFTEVMRDILIILTELLVILCVSALLLAVEPLSTLVAVMVLGVSSLVFYQLVRRPVGRWGKQQHYHMGQMMQWVNQGLGSIKEIRVLGRESYFLQQYRLSAAAYTDAMQRIQFINKLPRLYVETVAVIVLLLVLMLDLTQGRRPRSLLLLLSLFAMAAFRMMTSMNRIVAAVSTIRFYSHALDAVHGDLMAIAPGNPLSKFRPKLDPIGPSPLLQHSIELDRISYTYPEAQSPTLQNLSFKLRRGEAIGIAGPSGAGKTTLVDVLLGLLIPDVGEVRIDGEPLSGKRAEWQHCIGYIPQNIYLSDDTIRRNVAFGLADAEIDDAQVWRALRLAQLGSFTELLSQQLDTRVGEMGVRISGGQRQRIAIARALYHEPEVLVMDEATAALDNETERSIVQALETLRGEKTMIVIAHRLSTIRNCDRIFWMKQGCIAATGTYQDLWAHNAEFRDMVGHAD
ncbi:MAG: ABC transporter ATP-binding protein [Synechococcales cyanobacterium CRU_2_2]|nr:ABC transporter ATP-binding protein [Synechococcales cyanobacterium CRU_2_2]